jgi:hypothetical protein
MSKKIMKNQDFTTTIVVEQTPEQVFNAINNPRAWWSGEITGNTGKLNDEFTYRYKELHLSKQRMVEMIPGKKVVWLVTDSELNFIAQKDEWTNTKIIFEITNHDGQTQVKFTHLGLIPNIECFSDCSSAWGQIIRQGLYSLITTGKGGEIFFE